MNTTQINRKLRHYRNFEGAFPRDMLPNVAKRPVALIGNTDDSTQPGEHWIAIFLKENQTGEYFDSFGLPPLHQDVIDYLNRTCPRGWKYNTVTIQGVTSSTCGNYCVIFVALRLKNFNFKQILNLFTDNTRVNDRIVRQLFQFV